MKKQLFLFIALVSAMLSICSSCRDSPNNPDVIKICDPAKCTSWTGQECVSGDCVCTKGKRRIGGECLGSDTTFMGIAKSNIWSDTVILINSKYQTNQNYFTFSIKCSDKIKYKFPVPSGVGSTVAYRIKDNIKGDSLHEANVADEIFTMPDGSFLFPEFRGRILDSNTVRMRVTFCTHTSLGAIKNRVDSTEYIFRKIQ
jgi:hypothetical protein